MQTHIADTAVLSRSRPLFLFAFPTMLMQSRGRYIGGYRHVNFCHSYHPWAAPIKKSLAPPLGRYDYLSALSFQLKQKNYGYFCCASFPLCGAGAFCCRFFGKVPEVRRCRSPPPFDSPVNHPWIERRRRSASTYFGSFPEKSTIKSASSPQRETGATKMTMILLL